MDDCEVAEWVLMAPEGQFDNIMQISQALANEKMFARHELKFLNAGLILYICLGALLFHSLGEFEEPSGGQKGRHYGYPQVDRRLGEAPPNPPQIETEQPGGRQPAARARGLNELRLQSVRRMWNITNQLNILYEANWTELVLAELIEFEQRLVESLELVGQTERGAHGELEGPGEGERDEDKSGKADDKTSKSADKRPASRRTARARLKSIKKSLVHSIATITTMGKWPAAGLYLNSRGADCEPGHRHTRPPASGCQFRARF